MAFCAPILPLFASKGMAPLFIALSGLSIIAWVIGNKRLPHIDLKMLAIFTGFLILGGISTSWSLAPEDTWERCLKLLQIFIPVLGVSAIIANKDSAQLHIVAKALTFGLTAGIALYLFEKYSNFMIFNALYPEHGKSADQIQNKALYVLFALTLVSVFYCWHNRHNRLYAVLGAMQGIITPYICYYSLNSSISVCMYAVILGLLGSLAIPKCLYRQVFKWVVVITILTAPVFAVGIRNIDGIMETQAYGNTLKSRFEIWDLTARRSMERPLLGWGLNTSKHIPNRGEYSVLYEEKQKIVHLHPHNGVLQMWFELGLVGSLFLLAVIYRIQEKIIAATSNTNFIQKYSLIVLGTGFMYILPSFGLWQTWFLASLCIIGISYAAVLRTVLADQAEKQAA